MRYRVVVDSRAEKEIGRLNLKDQRWLSQKIEGLGTNPRPGGKNFRPLTGYDLYRLRVGGLRIIYSIDDKNQRVIIEKVRKRDQRTYKLLE